MRVSRRSFLVTACVAAAGCGGSTAHGPSRPLSRVGDAESGDALFKFHTGPWVNLHHVLYLQGVKRRGDTNAEHPGVADAVDTAIINADERRAWDAALDYYVSNVSDRNVVMDSELEEVNQTLSEHESAATLEHTKVPAPLAAALERAMLVYRTRFWADHDRANRAWIAVVTPELAKHGTRIADELSRLLRMDWPKEPLRVDVTRWAPPPGAAYTTLNPPHLTISGADARNQPPMALEILFHECSHIIIRRARDALTRELAVQHKDEPSLWHALLFFTSGDVVRRRLPAGYVTYADREGLYRDRWAAYRVALMAHWMSYLEGRAQFDDAIRALVTAL